MKKLTLGLAAICTLALVSPAMAGESVPTSQAQVRDALTTANINVTGERVVFTKRGRQDLVLQVSNSKAQMVRNLKKAYRSGSTLANGYHVAGWAHMADGDTYNFTFRRGDDRFIATVDASAGNAQVKIWGHRFNPKLDRVPGRTVPKRLDRMTKKQLLGRN